MVEKQCCVTTKTILVHQKQSEETCNELKIKKSFTKIIASFSDK